MSFCLDTTVAACRSFNSACTDYWHVWLTKWTTMSLCVRTDYYRWMRLSQMRFFSNIWCVICDFATINDIIRSSGRYLIPKVRRAGRKKCEIEKTFLHLSYRLVSKGWVESADWASSELMTLESHLDEIFLAGLISALLWLIKCISQLLRNLFNNEQIPQKVWTIWLSTIDSWGCLVIADI